MSEGNGNGRPVVTDMLLATGSRRKRAEVEIEGVAAPIVIVEMNVAERLAFFKNTKSATSDDFNFTEWGAWLLVSCLSDETGARLFPLNEDGFRQITQLSDEIFHKLVKEASDLHGFFKVSAEEQEKNSETLQSDNSSSSLVSNMESPLESSASA